MLTLQAFDHPQRTNLEVPQNSLTFLHFPLQDECSAINDQEIGVYLLQEIISWFVTFTQNSVAELPQHEWESGLQSEVPEDTTSLEEFRSGALSSSTSPRYYQIHSRLSPGGLTPPWRIDSRPILSHSDQQAYATKEPLSEMTINCVELRLAFKVHASQGMVTVEDVLVDVYNFFRGRLDSSDIYQPGLWELVSRNMQARVTTSLVSHSERALEMAQGPRRIDLLGGRCWFHGITWDEQGFSLHLRSM
ncbi:hypothetical protein C8Q75DRAFT_736588 [Abortiporus biennis]|nr:hypothetical protein C8Q75DRAFT_736588 [Abortiporus biennis]